ncbi:O-antigen ligase family protein [Paenibacillus chartarius]|uniref:O-antigen ligase family protein n=1 Tax=Paenibacillus chartarius TaxID=747481 RepID=A0ABV6DLM8_9BACL
MNLLIILSLLTSMLSGVLNKVVPLDSSSLTLVPVILIVVVYLIQLAMNKKIKSYPLFYLLIYICILLIFIGSFKNGMNITMIKFAFFYFVIGVLINQLTKEGISKLYNTVIILTVILSIEVFAIGAMTVATDGRLLNIRHQLMLDKQAYNIMYNFAIPILFWNLCYSRKIRDALLLMFFSITGLYFLQIKTLLLSIPISLLVIAWMLKPVSRKSLMTICASIVIVSIGVLNVFPQYIPDQIRIVTNYILGKEQQVTSDSLVYADTVVVREKIIENAKRLFQENMWLGIGYGNYGETVEGITVYSIARSNVVYQIPTVTENGIITFLVEGGLLAALVHLSLYAIILWKLRGRTSRDKTVLIGLTISFALFVSNFVQDNLNYSYWFSLALGLFLAKEVERTQSLRSSLSGDGNKIHSVEPFQSLPLSERGRASLT